MHDRTRASAPPDEEGFEVFQPSTVVSGRPVIPALCRRHTVGAFGDDDLAPLWGSSSPTYLLGSGLHKPDVRVEADPWKILDALEHEVRRWTSDRLFPLAVSKKVLWMVLKRARGGAMLIHAPTDELKRILGDPTDEGYLETRLHNAEILNVITAGSKFEQVLAEFSEHSETDRWPQDHADAAARGKSKDGAVVISATGNVRGAARQLTTDCSRIPFTWPDVGTRHKVSLAIAYNLDYGIAFVRSDSGKLHVVTSHSAKHGVVYGGCVDEMVLKLQPQSPGKVSRSQSVTASLLRSNEALHNGGEYVLEMPRRCEVHGCAQEFGSLEELHSHMLRCHANELERMDVSPNRRQVQTYSFHIDSTLGDSPPGFLKNRRQGGRYCEPGRCSLEKPPFDLPCAGVDERERKEVSPDSRQNGPSAPERGWLRRLQTATSPSLRDVHTNTEHLRSLGASAGSVAHSCEDEHGGEHASPESPHCTSANSLWRHFFVVRPSGSSLWQCCVWRSRG